MNTDFTVFGWVHTVASVLSLLIGAKVLFRAKGDATHKRDGLAYFGAMLVTNVTALLIYSLGTFRVFHWMAIGTLLLVGVGYQAAHSRRRIRGWLPLHIGSMVVSYYMLIGGTVNEAFLRVNALYQLPPDVRARLIGITHSTVMLIFAVVLTYLLTVARQHPSRSRR